MEAAAEAIAQGHVVGWARDPAGRDPVLVQIREAGEVLAEARATRFRPDLLGAGHGHGHYGFRARLRRPLPPGLARLALHLPALRRSLPVRLRVPVLPEPAPATVESLLRGAPGWTVAHLLASPGCLDLEPSLADMGPARFLDRLFRFALRRWPAEHETAFYAAALAAGEVTASGLLVELLTWRERADLGEALVSPWDPEFPFAVAGGSAAA